MKTFIVWAEQSGAIAYHATRANFSGFDISFAKDQLGMSMGEGLGHNKFYFAKNKKHAFPQTGSGAAQLITVELHLSKTYSGKLYTQRLRELVSKMSRAKAVDQLDDELKSQGYDSIDDGWQIAVYDPSKVKIINVEPWVKPVD